MLEETYRAEQRHFWYRGFRRFVRPLLERAASGAPGLRLLDCGCGTGANLKLLQEFGTAFGIDVTWRGLQFAHDRSVPRIARATVARLPFSSSTIDIAVSFDVLYCLDDDDERSAIAEMHRVLRPGGALIVSAAALDMLKGDHSVLVSEIRRYTRRRLADKLKTAGFRIDRITYTNASIFPITAGVRALQRLRGVKAEGGDRGDFYVPPSPINMLLAGALAVEARLIEAGINMPVGSSVVCLARKA
jgi:ubiquinone/menaquinone biosynthesis C-methylase UbiE